MTLRISFADVWRATLPDRSGNEGWLGVNPAGTAYHVVCPVDVQIARGVMACNRPTDGTPFGGYAGWGYFRCAPYESFFEDPLADADARNRAARETARQLVAWLGSEGLDACVEDSLVNADEPAPARSRPHEETRLSVVCGCGATWATAGEFLRTPGVRFRAYIAYPDDFRRGEFVFDHACGNVVRIGAGLLARSNRLKRSLAGSRGCPDYCRYESSTALCDADCEGAVYRRIARRLAHRGGGGVGQ